MIIARRQEDGIFLEYSDAENTSGTLAATISCNDWCNLISHLSQYSSNDPGVVAAAKDLQGIAETFETISEA